MLCAGHGCTLWLVRRHQAAYIVWPTCSVLLPVLRASRVHALLGVPALSVEIPPAFTSAASNSDSRVFWPGLNCMPWVTGQSISNVFCSSCWAPFNILGVQGAHSIASAKIAEYDDAFMLLVSGGCCLFAHVEVLESFSHCSKICPLLLGTTGLQRGQKAC